MEKIPKNNQLNELIAQGKTKEAIKELLVLTENSSFYKAVVNQSSKYEQNNKEYRKGTITSEVFQVQLAKINQFLLDVIEQISIKEEKLESNRYFKNLLKAYLKWIEYEYNEIYLPSIRERKSVPKIALERVYVALKVHSKSSSYELNNARKILEKKFKKRLKSLAHEPTEEEKDYIFSELIQENPKLRAWEAKQDLHSFENIDTDSHRIITLGEAFKNERYLVILGDPGSGKSTLSKWIALKLAKSFLDEIELGIPQKVMVPKNQIEIDQSIQAFLEDLGPARLPVLVRISEYSKFFEEHNEQERTLINYLGKHVNLLNHSFKELNNCIRKYLSNGSCVVILDGMDEVTMNRSLIIREIEKFIDLWINDRGDPDNSSWDPNNLLEPPVIVGGNQLIVTSRIVGYHSAPLSGNLTHVTIERMQEDAIKHFCDLWTEQIYFEEYKNEISDSEIKELAFDESQALKEAIFDDSKPLIRDLATNPLLVTILALVFRHQNRKLPQSRAELYERALTILVEKWRENIPISQEELRSVLVPVASHIHSSSSDDIKHSDLVRIVKVNLSKIRGYGNLNLDEVPQKFSDDVDAFLKKVREDVGILAERGNKLYHFLHRTFQEYLAGQSLISNQLTPFSSLDVQFAKNNIISRLSDPIWREPILLALGFIDLNWPSKQSEELIKELLASDDPLKDLVPRSSLFVASAITEMSQLQHDTIRLIIFQLLKAYSDQKGIGRFEAVKELLEKVISQLYKSDKNEVLNKVIKEILSEETPKDLKLGILHLIQKNEWWDPSWLSLIFRCLPIDNHHWNWPVEKILRQAFCFKSQKLNFHLLKFKKRLKLNPDWLKIINRSPAWTRLITVLYGGWLDSELTDKYVQFKEYSWNLYNQIGSSEDRYNMAIKLDTELGQLKTLYNNWPEFSPNYIYRESSFTRPILQALAKGKNANDLRDLFLKKLNDSKNEKEREEALLALFAIGEDVLKILSQLEKNEENQQIIQKFLEHLKRLQITIKSPLVNSIAYLQKNLLSLNETTLAKLADHSKADFVETITEIVNYIKLPPLHLSYNIPEKRFLSSSKASLPLVHFLNREYLANLLSGINDDPIYNLSVILDTIPKMVKGDLESFLSEVILIPNSLSINNYFRYEWEMPKVLFERYEMKAKLILALEIINGISEKFYFLKEWMIVSLSKLFKKSQDLYLLSATILYKNSNSQQNIHSIFLQCNLEKENPINSISQKTSEVKDPYVRFLIFYILFQQRPDFRLKKGVISAFSEIDTPLDRIKATNLILDIFSGSEDSILLKIYIQELREHVLAAVPFHWIIIEDAEKYIDKITNISNKIKALMVISEIHPEGFREEFIFKALDLIPKIEEDEKKVLLLKEIRKVNQKILESYPSFYKIESSFKSNWHFNKATDKKYLNYISIDDKISFGEEERLTSITEKKENYFPNSMVGFWSLITLFQSTIDLSNELQNAKANSGQNFYWKSVESTENIEEVLSKILEDGKNGVILTRSIADTINTLISKKKFSIATALLPLIENPTTNAWPVVEEWKHSDSLLVRNFYHLLKAESNSFTNHTVQALIALLQSQNDRLRCRAIIAINGPYPDAGNEDRSIFTAELGLDALMFVYKKILSTRIEDPSIAQTLGWINLNLAHNDESIIDKLVEKIRNPSELLDKKISRKIIEDIQFVSPNVWIKLIHYLKSKETGLELKSILLKLILKFCHLGGKFKIHWPYGAWFSLSEIITKEHLEILESNNFCNYNFDNILSTLEFVETKELLNTYEKIVLCNNRLDDIGKIKFPESLLVDGFKSYDSKLFRKFSEAGSTLFIRPDSIVEEAHLNAQTITEKPELLGLLFDWTLETLSDELIKDDGSFKGGKLALFSAATANLVPDTYSQIVDSEYAESVLTEVIERHPFWVARQGAINMLACLAEISEKSLFALEYALRDVDHVQEQAMKSYKYFKRIVNDGALRKLADNVKNGNGILAKISCQIITEVALTNNHDERFRKNAIEIISEALRSQLRTVNSGQFVYILDIKSDHILFKPKYIENLTDCFYNELIKITGIQ